MADETKTTLPQKTHAENILNRIVDLVPEARGHIGGSFKKLHDEILKLIPTGAIGATVTKDLELANAKIQELQTALDGADAKAKAAIDELTAKGDQVAKDLEAALTQIETLNQEAEVKVNELQTANDTIATLTADLEAAKAPPAGA